MTKRNEFTVWLMRNGFRVVQRYRGEGIVVTTWERHEGQGVRLELQIWPDGRHRVMHAHGGVMKTVPTGFDTVVAMEKAVQFEIDRAFASLVPDFVD